MIQISGRRAVDVVTRRHPCVLAYIDNAVRIAATVVKVWGDIAPNFNGAS